MNTSTSTNALQGPRGARGALVSVLLAVVALPVSMASAQNALGDGRALDNSLSTQGRYNTRRPSLQEEFAFRNSVVTGNAPNGLSFRGDVGYIAPSEFRGELGSNDLFGFRRDSLQSGIAGMGIRGTEALQYQLALTTGGQPPSNLVGRFSVSRSGTTPDAGNIVSNTDPNTTSGFSQRSAIDPDADQRGTMLWMLRSPSAYMSNSSLQASSLGRGENETGVYSWTASPLRGIRLSSIPELTAAKQAQREAEEAARQEATFGAASVDENGLPVNRPAERGAENAGQPGGQPGNQSGTQRGGQSSRQPTEQPTRVSTLQSDFIQGLIERTAASEEDVFDRGPTLAERIQKMRERLRSDDIEGFGADAQPLEKGEYDGEGVGRVRFDAETMQMLRDGGGPLSRFVDPTAAGRDVYAEHLAAGEALLAEGRYFDAEERFASALGIRRGDVTAQIGRLHAQIGAGLYLSASLNMQGLAAERPEMFSAKYAANLLPTRQRLDEVITVLREMIDGKSDASRRASPQVRQASGLILGYLGYQLGMPELVTEGMTDFRTRATRGLEPGASLPLEVRLCDLLSAMWMTGTNDD